jgi:hypothetical protein
MYRHSHRMVVSALSDYFGLKIGLGTVSRLRNQGSEAVSIAVEEAKVYVGLAEKVKKRKKCGLGKYGLKKHR